MALSRRAARPMLSAIFVAGGVDTLRDPGPRVKASEDVLSRLITTLGLRDDPELLVKVNAGVQVGAGVLLSLGRFRRLSSLALILSLIPTTYAAHRFWESDDPQERGQQRTHFLKNVGLLGGLLVELVDTEGAPSLGWRARRAAAHAGSTISAQRRTVGAHLPGVGDS
jgi:putative oxidoreductase